MINKWEINKWEKLTFSLDLNSEHEDKESQLKLNHVKQFLTSFVKGENRCPLTEHGVNNNYKRVPGWPSRLSLSLDFGSGQDLMEPRLGLRAQQKVCLNILSFGPSPQARTRALSLFRDKKGKNNHSNN